MQLPATATFEQASALLLQVDAALAATAAGAQLRLDASALAEFDTSTIALLLHARRVAHERGVQLTVGSPPSKLRELARLYGVDELLSLDAVGT